MSSASQYNHYFGPDASKEFAENVRRITDAINRMEASYTLSFEDVFEGHAVIRDEYVGNLCPDGSVEYRESMMYSIRGTIRIEPWWV